MKFTEAIQTCLSKFATFTGRAARPEFWWFMLFVFGVLLVASMLHRWLSNLAGLVLLLPTLAVAARRLHDIGKSAWFLLIGFIPVVGNLILLYWYLQPSDGPNEFGGHSVSPYSTTVMPGSGPQ